MLDLSEYPFQLSKSTIKAETSSISHLISPVKFVITSPLIVELQFLMITKMLYLRNPIKR